jgi:uncharacterized ion transporter superfamily protein YfcC
MNARPMDPILLVGSILLIAAALTWVVPAGHYQCRQDPNTGQSLVVPGSYRSAPRQPVGPWGMVLAITERLAQAAAVGPAITSWPTCPPASTFVLSISYDGAPAPARGLGAD